MQTSTILMRSLAAVVIAAFSIWTVTDAEKVSPCCVAVSRFMENIPITGYRLQEKSLPCIKAVILQTEKGQFCIDPYQPWVKKKINEFRRSKKKKISPISALPHRTSAPQSSTVSTQRETQQTTAHHSVDGKVALHKPREAGLKPGRMKTQYSTNMKRKRRKRKKSQNI